MRCQPSIRWVVVIGLGALVALADTAAAQRGRRGFGRLFGGLPKVDLLWLDEVESELLLSDEQTSKVDEIRDQLRNDRQELFQDGFGGFREIRQEMDKLNREASAQVSKLLDAAQRKRLQEIAIQVNGPAELSDPAVASVLELSEEQQTRLAEVRDENVQTVRDALLDFGDLSRRERRDKMRELVEASNQKLLAVLTDEQRAQFDQMKGEPLEIDWSQLRRRRGERRSGSSDE